MSFNNLERKTTVSEKIAAAKYQRQLVSTGKQSGVDESDGKIELSYICKQPTTFIIYYGQLQYSGVSDYSIYDFIVANDTTSTTEVQKCRDDGCLVVQYVAYGSRFEDTEDWKRKFKATIWSYKEGGYADGIFFDECEVGYWNLDYYTNPEKIEKFWLFLKEVCDWCRDIGLITVVNGVRAFCDCGDYWLWESFGGYWNTNRLNFDNTGAGSRSVGSDGAITYSLNFSEWTLDGSLTLVDGKITDGSDGYMQIDIKPEDYLDAGDQLSIYDWVYFEWFGSGADDDTLEIYAWYGDTWPFDATWTEMDKLYSGLPATWNGLGIQGKYVRIKMIFNGADELSMDSCVMFYGYLYPYYNLQNTNGDADTNIQAWNYNSAQLAYILSKQNSWFNNPTVFRKVQPLCHCYGLFTDTDKVMYMYILSKIFEFPGWDYTHPLHQYIQYTDILDDPFGMLLSRTDNGDGTYSGIFTHCTVEIDTVNNTYTLTRTEPSYWYDRAITIDGDMSDWSGVSAAYTNSNTATLHLYKIEVKHDFDTGTFVNTVKVGTVIDLIADGTGAWTSPEIEPTQIGKMIDVVWDGVASGVVLEIRYKVGSTWGSYQAYTRGTTSGLDVEFEYCQVRVTITGTVGNNTFYGYSLYYKPELPECLNVRNIYITDDNSYIYIRVKYNDVIDMDTHIYNLYFYTKTDEDTGFLGDWWETSFGVHFYIYNTSLYRWDDTHTDRTDTDGFEYLGHIFDYEFSDDGKEVEYSIKKSILGRLPAEEIKVYALVSEAVTNYTALINPSGVNVAVSPVAFSGEMEYTQTQYHNYSPHGFYCSDEEIFALDNSGFSITFDAVTPDDTTAKMYIRYKNFDEDWEDWEEVESEYSYTSNVQKMQYCVSLSTTDKTATPYIENIVITEL